MIDFRTIITLEPGKRGGTPCVRGLRITVQDVLEWLANSMSVDDILGEYPELVAKGMKDTGSDNYGGPIVTANGLLFIGATNFDKKFRAYDKLTGKLLWETVLPAAGNATPAIYQLNGKEYVVIVCGGGKNGAPSGSSIVAFSL